MQLCSKFMNKEEKYQEILSYLFSQFPQYQHVGASAYKSGLEDMQVLDHIMGHPHQKFPSVHVAGTNGKGSVSHMLAAVLQRKGYRTGLYTSPHLVDFRERIRINGTTISKEEVVEFAERYRALFDKLRPSFFEITTTMAFCYFAQQKVDIAIIETGLGGRLDSTNVIHPILSLITNIGFDHCEYLGNTLAQIANEKAGIIKPQTPVVVGERHPETDQVFINIAQKQGATLYFAEDFFKVDSIVRDGHYQFFMINNEEYCSDLKGDYQQKNIPTVLKATEFLPKRVTTDVIKLGLRDAAHSTGLRGRWECISQKPRIIVDAAHNAHGLRWVTEQLKNEKYRQLHFVFGVVAEKDLASISPLLPKDAVYYYTNAKIPRALNANLLAWQCRNAGLVGEVVMGVSDAVAAARRTAQDEDLIFVGGSIFVVAEALEIKWGTSIQISPF